MKKQTKTEESVPDNYLSILRERGNRITPVMVAAVSYLHKTRRCHSPQEIQKGISGILGCSIGLPTIYRTIERLLSAELIVPLFAKNMQTSYYICQSPGNNHHHHFVCSKCKEVQDVHHCVIDGFEEYVKKSLNAHLTDHIVQLEGLCSKCMKKL